MGFLKSISLVDCFQSPWGERVAAEGHGDRHRTEYRVNCKSRPRAFPDLLTQEQRQREEERISRLCGRSNVWGSVAAGTTCREGKWRTWNSSGEKKSDWAEAGFLGGQSLMNLPGTWSLSVLPLDQGSVTTSWTIGAKNINYFIWEGRHPFHKIPEPRVHVKTALHG